jgi:cation:H+ antiporter
MDAPTIALLLAGLALLVVGADVLVRGASRLAAAFGISPLVIGLTVVAYGTGAPELAVSVTAGLSGQPDIAVANVVGSNVVNVLLILGATTLVSPIRIDQQFVRREVPIMIAASVLLYAVAYDGRLGGLDAAVLLAGIVAYTVAAVKAGPREVQAVADEYSREFGADCADAAGRSGRMAKQVGLIVVGFALLVLGSRWMVSAASDLARAIGLSETVIGLTVVAFGTSLPEIATSLAAALRGERDIAVGNVVGSNIYNVLGILGIAALVTDGGLTVASSLVTFDIPVMIAAAVVCLPVFFTGHQIDRWEGGLLLAYYVAYTAYLVMNATHHDALPAYSAVMATFVLPLTAVTLAVLAANALRQRAGRG